MAGLIKDQSYFKSKIELKLDGYSIQYFGDL